MRISSETANPFEGQVFVKGHFQDPDCIVRSDGSRSEASISVLFDKCGTVKRRSQNPRGVYVENTVVFKFHPRVMTKIDRVFKIKCFYMESQKTVHQDIEVSMLTTAAITAQFEMPTCTYTIHSNSPDGPQVRFAVVGQKVIHKWQCDSSNSQNLFKMRVHSCTVGDGNGDPITLLNSDGCAVDKYLLSNLDYSEEGMIGFVESHVFKFADRTQLFFQCQVELCNTLENGCLDTPPNCPALSRRRRAGGINYDTDVVAQTSDSVTTVDVITDPLTIADPADVIDSGRLLAEDGSLLPSPADRSSPLVCLTYVETYLYVFSTLGSFMLVSTILLMQQIRAQRRPSVPSKHTDVYW